MGSKQISQAAVTVGRNISLRRKELGMRQDDLAERLDITSSALSRIENGSSFPRINRIEEISRILGCEVIDLFRRPGEPLHVSLDDLEDLLRPYPANVQQQLLSMLTSTLRTIREVFGIVGN